MTVYINVSNTFNTRMKSGIQRVVREIVSRIYRDDGIALIAWDKDAFCRLASSSEITNFLEARHSHPGQRVSLDELTKGDFFFDLDAYSGS